MRIVMANDHGGVKLAELLKKHLEDRGIEVNYLGTAVDEACDYPDVALKAVAEYRKGGYDFGVLLCGTGIGISMSANKMVGIRCALPQDSFAADKAKRHNNVNFIAFGGRIQYTEDPREILDAYIDATYEGGRHQIRIEKLMALQGK